VFSLLAERCICSHINPEQLLLFDPEARHLGGLDYQKRGFYEKEIGGHVGVLTPSVFTGRKWMEHIKVRTGLQAFRFRQRAPRRDGQQRAVVANGDISLSATDTRGARNMYYQVTSKKHTSQQLIDF